MSTAPSYNILHTKLESDFDGLMRLGHAALLAKDYGKAEGHFERAHAVGHDDLARHVKAHRALLSLAWVTRKPGTVISEVLSLLALRVVRPSRKSLNKSRSTKAPRSVASTRTGSPPATVGRQRGRPK
jgi:hypothetical protein